MKAIVMEKSGGPEVLKLKNREAPGYGSGEVLVKVKCTSVNRADIIQRKEIILLQRVR